VFYSHFRRALLGHVGLSWADSGPRAGTPEAHPKDIRTLAAADWSTAEWARAPAAGEDRRRGRNLPAVPDRVSREARDKRAGPGLNPASAD